MNPLYLIGAVGVLLPLLIHLMTRERVQRTDFPTLRFFVKTARTTLARKWLREAWLVALRTLLCLLLAMLFIAPAMGRRSKGAGDGDGVARVIVVDVSGSMGRAVMQKSFRDIMKDLAREAGDGKARVAVLAFDSAPRLEAGFDSGQSGAREALEQLKPGQGGSNFDAALRKANEMLENEKAGKKEIVFVSDMQKIGWARYRGDWRFAAGVDLVSRPVVPDGDESNVAITQGDAPGELLKDGQARSVGVRVTNSGKKPVERAKVVLIVNNKIVNENTVTLPAGGTVPVRFQHRFDQMGDNPGMVRVEVEDADTSDNVFYFNARVQPRIRVVALNGRVSSREQDDAGTFIRAALDMEESPFELRMIEASRASASDLKDAGVVLLVDVDSLGGGVVAGLRAVLKNGGGLLLLPGRGVDPGRFKGALGDVSPCVLRKVVSLREKSEETTLADVDFDHPAFAIFKGAGRGNFRGARFYSYWEVSGSQTARVLARFDNGAPAILEKKMGDGTTLLAMTPGDLDWTDFPQRALFLPYLHELIKYLGARAAHQTSYTVGDPIEAPADVKARGADGRDIKEVSGVTQKPGLYTIASSKEGMSYQVAVNRDWSEADAARIDAGEMKTALTRESGAADEPAAGGKKSEHTKKRYLSLALLMAFCSLAAVELAAGNRVIRH